jgi:predicted metal-dependent hydrolase
MGFLWEAHEQWEGIWKASPDPSQRDFLQGLVQVAAAVLKLRLGNARGAAKLARRAREHLTRVPGERFMGLALEPLRDARPEAPPRLEVR